MRWGVRGALLGLIVCSAGPVGGQATGARGVVETFLADLAAERYADAARLLDSTSFRATLRRFVAGARRDSADRPYRAQRLRAIDSTMTPEVVAWFERAARARDSLRPGDVAYEFEGVPSLAALEALSLDEAMVKWLQAHDPGRQFRRLMVEQRCDVARDERAMRPSPFDMVLVATVDVDDSTAYALVRQRRPLGVVGASTVPRARPTAWEVRRRPEGWRVTADEVVLSGGVVRVLRPTCQAR